MKSVLIISPTYLTALHKESRKFSFAFHGYGSFKFACDGLLEINSGNLLGVAYVADKLPEKTTSEYIYMNNFLSLCDKLEDSKKFVFVLREQAAGVNELVKSLTRLRVFVTADEMNITDTVINQKVFGSLLLDNNEPYKLTDKQQASTEFGDYLLQMSPVVSRLYLMCLDEIVQLGDYQTTLENDLPYQEYVKTENTLLAMLRNQRIARAFNLNDRHLDLQITQRLNTLADNNLWCLCKVIQGM